MKKSASRDAGRVVDPKHPLQPQDFLIFNELSGFIDDWIELRQDVEFDLLVLQTAIMAQPKGGAVIPGTGGLRKLEFIPPSGVGGSKKGKRNACRVCYVYFEEFFTVLLVTAYSKDRKQDLSEDEKKNIKKAIERVHASLSARCKRTK